MPPQLQGIEIKRISPDNDDLTVKNRAGGKRSKQRLFQFGKVAVERLLVFFFQAEDGIRALIVTGVQKCALPICDAEASARGFVRRRIARCRHRVTDRKSVAQGKSVDLGGRRIIKKKK